MALDPQAQAVLDMLAGLNMAPLDTLTAEQARAQSKAFAVPPSGEQVANVEDRTVLGPGGPIPVRVYTPAGAQPHPALVYYHGGGWVLGDLEGTDNLCRALTNAAGAVVVSVDYRLAPEHRFPAAVDDAFAAVKHVYEQAASYGVDPARIAVGGDSAGGNLAAVVAVLARDSGLPVRFQLLAYPVTNHSFDSGSYDQNGDGYLLTTPMMKWFWDLYLGPDGDGSDFRASPLRAPNLKGVAPALVITAEYDPLRDEGEAYAARLQEAGVRVKATRYPGMIHGFFTMTAALDQAKAALAEAATEMKAALGAH